MFWGCFVRCKKASQEESSGRAGKQVLSVTTPGEPVRKVKSWNSCISTCLSVCRSSEAVVVFQSWPACQETRLSAWQVPIRNAKLVCLSLARRHFRVLIFQWYETESGGSVSISPQTRARQQHTAEDKSLCDRKSVCLCGWQKRRRVTHPPLGFETYLCGRTDSDRP